MARAATEIALAAASASRGAGDGTGDATVLDASSSSSAHGPAQSPAQTSQGKSLSLSSSESHYRGVSSYSTAQFVSVITGSSTPVVSPAPSHRPRRRDREASDATLDANHPSSAAPHPHQKHSHARSAFSSPKHTQYARHTRGGGGGGDEEEDEQLPGASPARGTAVTPALNRHLQPRQREREAASARNARAEKHDEASSSSSGGPLSLGGIAAAAGGTISNFFGGLGRSASHSLRSATGGAYAQQYQAERERDSNYNSSSKHTAAGAGPDSAADTAHANDDSMMLMATVPEHPPSFDSAGIAGAGTSGFQRSVDSTASPASVSATQRRNRRSLNVSEGAVPLSGPASGAAGSIKSKKKGAPPELLVIVRPPPSKHVHPFTMQVQLVTPLSGSQQGASRPSIDGGRSSMDSARLRSSSPVVFPDDPPQAGVDTSSASGKERRRMSSSSIDPPSIPRGTLDRSFSMSSTVSDASSGAASASFHAPQPGHGAGPAAALQRSSRVMPLYNLSFHAILPTTITDAGTDQRVAKVSKKGHIELDGFGVLEPHELVIGVSDLATLHRATLAANVVAATTVAPAADTAAAVQGEGQPLHNIAPPQRSSMLDTTDSSTFSTSNGSKSIPSGVIPAPCSAKQSASAAAGPGTVEPPTGFQATAPEAKAFDGDKIGAKLIRGIKRLSLASQSKSQGQQQQQQQQPQSPHGSHGILSPASSLVSIVSQGSRLRTSLDVTSHAQVLAENISLASRGATLLSGVTVATDSLPMVPLERKPGQKRAEGYYWTVRKWTRKLDEQLHHSGAECEARRHAKPTESAAAQQLDGFGPGQNEILTKVWKRFNLVNRMGGSEVHPDVRSIPFRLEWTRDTQRIHRRRATEEARAAAQAGIVPRRTPSQLRGGGGDNSSNRPGSRHNSTTLRPALIPNTLHGSRPSSMHGGSQAAAEVSSVSGSSAIDHGDRSRGTEEDSSLDHDRSIPTYDDDDESDPEDSETPWSCHLVLGPQTRIPIGTLVPAPHHPALIAQLAIPFPLPDLRTSGLGADGAGLTREELKDIINVTVLHLVVRESFGGLGKKKGKK